MRAMQRWEVVLCDCLEEFTGRWDVRYEGMKSQEYLPGTWGVDWKVDMEIGSRSQICIGWVCLSQTSGLDLRQSRGYRSELEERDLSRKRNLGVNNMYIAGV